MWIIFRSAFFVIVPVLLLRCCEAGSLINRGESWPRMPNYDIWGSPSSASAAAIEMDHHPPVEDHQNLSSASLLTATRSTGNSRRNGKVLNFFPLHSDDECLSEDGRRVGACLNVYECRLQGGHARGECALGFGVCCVFVATCDQEIVNNITYIVSPNFPAVMSRDVKNCKLKIRPMNEHISQLRFDFIHFQMGQPNRRTGVCEGDFFSLRGGHAGLAAAAHHVDGEGESSGEFTICGQNSGQHLYYDIDPPQQHKNKNQQQKPSKRDNAASGGGGGNGLPQIIDIVMNFNQRFFLPRMWEIRVTQIPFSQRAPHGCLQYFTGGEGLIQTFNFADNGRHLANQNYRACIRQETGMCSIAYEPCDDQSFRISPNNPYFDPSQGFFGMSGFGGYPGQYPGGGFPGAGFPGAGPAGGPGGGAGLPGGGATLFGDPVAGGGPAAGGGPGADAGAPAGGAPGTLAGEEGGASPLADTPVEGEEDLVAAADGDGATDGDVADETPEDTVQADEPEVDDGSGGGAVIAPATGGGGGGFFSRFTSFFSRTLPSFSFSFYDDEGEVGRSFDRQISRRKRREAAVVSKAKPRPRKRSRDARQLYHYCNDRITLPCVIEDFIGTGASKLASCLPIHCGNSLCLPGESSQCRMETSVTPFALGFHFGEGRYKGSAEDNIGACLRYFQVPCL